MVRENPQVTKYRMCFDPSKKAAFEQAVKKVQQSEPYHRFDSHLSFEYVSPARLSYYKRNVWVDIYYSRTFLVFSLGNHFNS